MGMSEVDTSRVPVPEQEPLIPPDSWPGAHGRRSVAPVVPSWPGAPAPSPSGPGGSWPGATVAPASRVATDDAAASLDPVTLRRPRHHVSPRVKHVWRLSAAIGWVVPLAAVIAWIVLFDEPRTAQWVTLAVLLVLVLLHIVLMPIYRFRVHRWEVTADAVYTQSGWISQERRIAPISRIQTVDSEFGPIERLFGLGTLTVTTASAAGALRVSGLERARVDELVEELTRVSSAVRGDAT